MLGASIGRVFSFALAFGVLLSIAGSARAQTVAVGNENGITRSFPDAKGNLVSVPFRTSAARRFWVSRSDCLGGEVLTFPVTISGYQTLNLQVWAGATDCSQAAQRVAATAAQCWEVFDHNYNSVPTSGTVDVQIFARNIVAQQLPSTGTTIGASLTEADASVCTNPALLQQQVALYFMLVDTTETLHGSAVAWQATTNEQGMGFDISAPAPPTSITLTGGEGVIHASWATSLESDTYGYNIYCDPPPGALSSDGGGLSGLVAPPLGTLAPLLDASIPGAGGAVGVGGTGGTGGTLGAGGAAGSAAGGASAVLDSGSPSISDSGLTGVVTDAGAASLNCAPTSLTAGTDPDPKYLCGSTVGNPVGGTATGKAKNLVNEVQYVVAVAAVDTVGNIGKLSPNACAKPVQITDFFELYQDLGGKGGCSTSGRNGTSGWTLAALGAFVSSTILRRVRRRS